MYLPKYRNINIDGAYFGTTFPHLFLQSYKEAAVLPPKIYQYEPKIHGFKISNRPGYTENALDSVAATTLNSFRIDESEPEKLLQSEPPAWIYFSDTNNSLSSTALRDGRNK